MPVLVVVADGSEEIEVVSVVDVLRRAGLEVSLASCSGALEIVASRGVKLVADLLIEDCSLDAEHYQAIVVPGGLVGAEALRDHQLLQQLILAHNQRRQCIAAICAAPVLVLQELGVLDGLRATAHDAFVAQLGQIHVSGDVVVDAHVITSRAPGTAILFALAIVESLLGWQKSVDLAGSLAVSWPDEAVTYVA